MTGYHFTVGYNAGRIDEEDAWKTLKHVTRQICDHPQMIVKEARRLTHQGSGNRFSEKALSEYTEAYQQPFEADGHPITIFEKTISTKKQIMQLASGSSKVKFYVRRAFARLLIQEMHRREVEINMFVA